MKHHFSVSKLGLSSAALLLTPSFAHASCTQENIVTAGAVADATTGDILSAHGNIDQRFNPASLTKIISTLVVLEAIQNGTMSPQQILTVAPAQDGYVDDLRAGLNITLENALRISSASQNGIYNAIANAYPGGRVAFLNRMNEIARLAGAENTQFINPNGLFLFGTSQGCARHYTTVRDMMRITYYAQQHYAEQMRRYLGQPVLQYDQSGQDTSLLPRLNPTSALLADRDNIYARYNLNINFLKTGFIRYSNAHILADATIDGHRIIGIEIGVSRGVSAENRWYKNRDMRLLNAMVSVRSEFAPQAFLTAPQQPVNSDLLPVIQDFQPNLRQISNDQMIGARAYLTSSAFPNASPMEIPTFVRNPAPQPRRVRDNFLPVSMRPPRAEVTAEAVPVPTPSATLTPSPTVNSTVTFQM